MLIIAVLDVRFRGCFNMLIIAMLDLDLEVVLTCFNMLIIARFRGF